MFNGFIEVILFALGVGLIYFATAIIRELKNPYYDPTDRKTD